MSTSLMLHPLVRRGLKLAAFVGAGLAVASAQTAPASNSAPVEQSWKFQVPATLSPLGQGSDGLYSSSLASADVSAAQDATMNLASLEKGLSLPDANAMQYGQRRRYGAPRYRGGNTNADGSEKYTFYAGAGFQIPVGNNSDFLTTSWGIQAGGGRNFNRHFGVGVEFDYDKFGVSDQTVLNYAAIFDDPTNQNGFGANAHIWSFSVQPVYQIYSGPGLGAYITGGVGFYHKVTNFTLPSEAEECYYYCETFLVNENYDHYTSNAPGFDGGIGLTYKFSRFSGERLYAEVRYVYINNQFKPGYTTQNADTYTGYNLFPQNSNTTSYIPVKFGIRF